MRYVIKIALIGLALNFAACDNAGKHRPKEKKYKYVCIMDPKVGSDKPGTCSRCGMELVERDTTED